MGYLNKNSGKIYETIGQAASAASVTVTEMTNAVNFKLPINGEIYERLRKKRPHRKEVRCLETLKIYKSVTEAANSAGVSVAAMSHALNGRKSRLLYEFTGNDISQPLSPPKPPIRDDAGNEYRNYQELADAKGLTYARARTLCRTVPDGVFYNEWLVSRGFTTMRHDGSKWVINGSLPARTMSEVRRILRMLGRRTSYAEALEMMEYYKGNLFS